MSVLVARYSNVDASPRFEILMNNGSNKNNKSYDVWSFEKCFIQANMKIAMNFNDNNGIFTNQDLEETSKFNPLNPKSKKVKDEQVSLTLMELILLSIKKLRKIENYEPKVTPLNQYEDYFRNGCVKSNDQEVSIQKVLRKVDGGLIRVSCFVEKKNNLIILKYDNIEKSILDYYFDFKLKENQLAQTPHNL